MFFEEATRRRDADMWLVACSRVMAIRLVSFKRSVKRLIHGRAAVRGPRGLSPVFL